MMTAGAPLRITADELNCLIYSYFQDSGLVHSAFTILNEGHIQNSPYLAKHIPRGELIDLLGKALLYLEVEAHWRPDAITTDCQVGFSLLEPHICSSDAIMKPPVSSSSTSAVPLSMPQPQTSLLPIPPPSASAKVSSSSIKSSSFVSQSKTSQLPPVEAGSKRKSSPVAVDVPTEKRQKTEPQPSTSQILLGRNGQASKPKPAKESKKTRAQGPGDDETDLRSIRMLSGHNTEVFVCAWNPASPDILSTGAKDSEVILWDLAKKATSPNEFVTEGHMLASLGKLSQAGQQGDLTSLHWSHDGQLLAIGSYDSVLRVATKRGTIWMTSNLHEGPIFATRFSRKGAMLLTASLDGTACVWDVTNKKLHRQYRSHKGNLTKLIFSDSCLDVDWINDKIFASTGADRRVLLMHIDQDEPIKILEGHEEEVNQIRVNSAGTRIASCSDDGTSRIWRTDNIFAEPEGIPGLSNSTPDNAVVLQGHSEPVSAVAWCPAAVLWNGHEILATASFDKTARLWDSVTGDCLATFTDHFRPVYTLTFCPDGRFVATGGGDGWLYVYSTTTHKLVWSWFAGADRPGVFEVDWQMKNGYNRISLALEARKVMVLDCTKIPALQ
ncbi:WD40 repeat-like protein [Coprinellus micaceus]|uniref:WD40 repeat-like protein n=1 Tax=Coprinellus micaceus TaxID=71717 RepID=A0A4Y7TYQ7_COPMI|nr:WD40 repeat-like protein [Coprinellus micaceus]